MTLLATTALEATWGDGEPVLFLGEWCRLYDRRAVWEKLPHQVVRNHWDDRSQLRHDCAYLKTLHDALLTALTRSLNRYHRVDCSSRYWQTVLDPWLLTYVAVVWDRWECLRIAFEENGRLEVIALDSEAECRSFSDFDDFIERVLNDAWNCRLFLEIIESEYADRCCIVRRQAPTASDARNGEHLAAKLAGGSLKARLLCGLDAFLGYLPNRSRAVLVQSAFPPGALMRLQLKLGQVPRLYRREFEWPVALGSGPEAYGGDADRNNIVLDLEPKDAFESFLFKRLVRDIPVIHVEKRSAILKKAAAIPLKPRVILSATAHWGNDLFKVWSAEQVNLGAKLVAMSHGGCFQLLFDTMSFEEGLADVKTVWVNPFHPKQVKLPCNKLIAKRYRSTRELLAVIGMEMPRYPYRAISTPHGGQTLVNFEHTCEFYSHLDPRVMEAFRIRPYPSRGWNTRQRYTDRLGANRISNEKTYQQLISRARMIVCTYPETTFLEAMASGVPAILCYPAHLWETIPEMDPLLATLKAAKIVFDDPVAAAAHVNAVWEAPQRWWSTPDVLAARAEFRRQALDLSEDWLEQWMAFIEAQADGAAHAGGR